MIRSLIKNPLFVLGVNACLVFAAYACVLNGQFKIMDDEISIVHNEQIRSFANVGGIFTSSFFGSRVYYRPLISFSFMVEYHLFGLNPFFYYLTNILLHIATSLVVFGILSLILKNNWLSFVGSVLFAIHPVHWEAVSNIPGRAILMCAFFYLTSFWLFCRARLTQTKGAYVLSLFAFVFALLSKESAGMLPLLLLSYLFFLKREEPAGFFHRCFSTVPFFAIAGIYVLFRRSLDITHVFLWRSVSEAALGFLSFLRGAITFLRLFILPVDLQFDRATPVFAEFSDPTAILTILFFVAVGILIFQLRNKISLAAKFFIAWFAIELVPVSQFLFSVGVQPGYISTAEHFLYTPSVGIIALMVLGADNVYKKVVSRKVLSRTAFVAIVVLLCGFLFLSTVQHNIYSSNEIAMFERTLELNPNNARIRNSLALAVAHLGRFEESEQHFRKVLEVDPGNPRARIGLGKSLCDQGKFWQGIQEYEKVREPSKELEVILKGNLAATYQTLEQRYHTLLAQRPDDAQVHYSLGVVYSKTFKPDRAIGHYQKSIALDPTLKNALFNLASIYSGLGNDKEALAYYQRMIDLDGPEDHLDVHAIKSMVAIYQKYGDLEKAGKYNELLMTLMSTDIKR